MAVKDTEQARKAAGDFADTNQDPYRMVVGRALAARESNSRLARDFFEATVDEIQEQARLNRDPARELARLAREQGEALEELADESAVVYEEFLGPPPDSMRK